MAVICNNCISGFMIRSAMIIMPDRKLIKLAILCSSSINSLDAFLLANFVVAYSASVLLDWVTHNFGDRVESQTPISFSIEKIDWGTVFGFQ